MTVNSPTRASLAHGGDLGAARRLFPGAPEPFIDLSTGINPHAYPLPALPPELFRRLPEPAELIRLASAAARAYRAPSPAHVVPAPGTQILLTHIARLVPCGHAAVLVPTYAEHARAAALAGHTVREVGEIEYLASGDLAIVTNPNNPDGRVVARGALLELADELRSRNCMLVVDEAFMDVGPADASLAADVGRDNVVVLRSFGKFFGLAGVRLGFALTGRELAARLSSALGPWPVAGPAIAIGQIALADTSWAELMRIRLGKEVRQLSELLIDSGLEIIGGTSLFQLVQTPSATELFHYLGRAGIFVRRFAERPNWLRFGLPARETAWRRLRCALGQFARTGPCRS